jgi:hypothetical protein
MEHNLVGYAEYYSYGCTKILGSSEFTRETDHSRRDFSIEVTYEIRVFLKGAQKEVFSSILKKSL